MSLPFGSVPRMCPGENAGWLLSRMLPPTGLGSDSSVGPRKQAITTKAISPAGIQVPRLLRRRRRPTLASASSISGAMAIDGAGSTTAIADPRVQDGVQQVDDQVGDHRDEREDHDRGLHDDEFTGVDGLQ